MDILEEKINYINSVKRTLKILSLKAKDFKIKKVDMRRYGSGSNSEVYVWCNIDFMGMSIYGGDPHSGGMNTYIKYSYIHTTLIAIYADISETIFKEALTEKEKQQLKKEFSKNLNIFKKKH